MEAVGGCVKGDERTDDFWDVTQHWNAGWRRATSKTNELKKIYITASSRFLLILPSVVHYSSGQKGGKKKENEQRKKIHTFVDFFCVLFR